MPTKESDPTLAWQQFEHSGLVLDYLNYVANQATEEQTNASITGETQVHADQNTRSCFKTAQHWRE